MSLLTRAVKKANQELAELTRNQYFEHLPISSMAEILTRWGFDASALNGIYCGREGRTHQPIGSEKWFAMTWYRMGTGNYEVVAYVS